MTTGIPVGPLPDQRVWRMLRDAYEHIGRGLGVLHPQASSHTATLVLQERAKQDNKWGEQNHPDGTDARFKECADVYRSITNSKAKEGIVTWKDILLEEVWKALAETDQHRLHDELIQTAAVCEQWAEAIRRR